jgi:AraC-like DNA-binding protein
VTQSKDLVFNAVHAVIFLDLMEEHGVYRSDVLRGAHLSSSALQDLDQFITFSQYRTILQNGSHLSEDPLLGLHFGQRLNITGHGELGIAALSCKNYYELIRLSSRYLRIIAPFTRMELVETEDRVELRQEFTVPVGDMGAYLIDIAFGIYSSIVETVFHTSPASLKFYSKYVSPPHANQYASELPYDIVWNHGWNGSSISREMAFQKLTMANPTTLRHYEERLTDLMNRTHKKSEIILPKIRKIISAEPGVIPALEDVADQMHVSPRTLNRRFQEIGTSYKEVVAEVRKDLSLDYLRSGQFSIEEVSDLLGYSSPSNFGKAFKVWTGFSPSQYPFD